MIAICAILALTILALVVFTYQREKANRADRETHRIVVADLLDRVMARSYGEYVASVKPGAERPLRRRVLSDEEMAEIEKQTLAAAGRDS